MIAVQAVRQRGLARSAVQTYHREGIVFPIAAQQRFAISKNSQQESAMPTGQETKSVSTSDIKPDSLLPRRRHNL